MCGGGILALLLASGCKQLLRHGMPQPLGGRATELAPLNAIVTTRQWRGDCAAMGWRWCNGGGRAVSGAGAKRFYGKLSKMVQKIRESNAALNQDSELRRQRNVNSWLLCTYLLLCLVLACSLDPPQVPLFSTELLDQAE